ncbi:MAG: GGDEF domain-containing protein [Gammaproteobacteria bacterium]|nr:GGDEF domain-containing protein [Gammaproteobacteria bacterium]
MTKSDITNNTPGDLGNRILTLLDGLRSDPTGAAIYEHIRIMLAAHEHTEQDRQHANRQLLELLTQILEQQPGIAASLRPHLQVLRMRLNHSLSAAEFYSITSIIATLSAHDRRNPAAVDPMISVKLDNQDTTQYMASQPSISTTLDTPTTTPPQNKAIESLLAALTDDSSGEDDTTPVVQNNSLYRKQLDDKRARIQKIQQTLTQQVNEVIRQNEEFGVLLEVEHETLRQTDDMAEINTLKHSLTRQIEKLRKGHDSIARKLDKAKNYLKIIESEGHLLNDELTRAHMLSLTDELTDLPNRRAFMRRLEDEVARVQRYGSPLTLALIDLDHFKAINDKLGHPAGDEVLRNFSKNVLSLFRHHDLVARYGGEEFAIVLPNTTLEGAERALQKVQQRTAAVPFDHDGESHPMPTLSAGIAQYHPGDTPGMLIENADRALYQAKNLGRNRIEIANGRKRYSTPRNA